MMIVLFFFFWGGADTVDGSEIPNNHLGCIKPCKLVQDFFHQQYHRYHLLVGGWTNSFKKILVKLDHFPNFLWK